MEEATVSSDCQELNNIKYKTMLLNGVAIPESRSSNNLSNLDKFLEKEKNNNENEPWCKLNKTIKTKKLQEYVEIYKTQHDINADEGKLLMTYLRECIDRKKLQRVKDVIYDREKGVIKEIPGLCYLKASKHFTIKNVDKRISTLKSLAPKKAQGTIRKKSAAEPDSDEEEEES